MDFQLTEEQRMLQREVRRLVDTQLRPIAEEIDSAKVTPPQVLKILGDAGLFALYVPKRYGGQSEGEFSALPVCY